MKNQCVLGCIGLMILMCGCGNAKHDPHMITVWHWMADRHDVFVQLAAKYKQETGITVNFQLFVPSDVYSQKITAAAQAKILPDIFGVLDEKSVFGEFIKNGFIANLKEDFEKNHGEWQKMFFEKALAGNIFIEGNSYQVPPGIYAVPLDVTTEMIVYNKEILEKAGVTQLPQTFEEFVDAAQKIKAIGVTPFVSGWREPWLMDCFSSNYAFNIMGEEKVMATYRGEVPYTDPQWIEVFRIFETLAKKGVVERSIVTKANKTAEQDFALQRAAFAFNGSWCVNVYYDMMNPKFDYGVMLPPPISNRFPLKVWGAAGSSFMVNESSLNKKQSIAFLRWLSDKEQQIVLSEATKNLPANQYALASLPEQLEEFGQGMEYSTHPTIWSAEEDVLVKERFLKGLQSIIIGEKTPEQVASEVQSLKERQLQRVRPRR